MSVVVTFGADDVDDNDCLCQYVFGVAKYEFTVLLWPM